MKARRWRAAPLLAALVVTQAAAANELTTGASGLGQAFSNVQASTAINFYVPQVGVYPSRSSGFASGHTLGEIRMLAGSRLPDFDLPADGRTRPIAGNEALFSLFGTSFGGDGRTTFGLPDVRGRAVSHADPGQSQLGPRAGTLETTLTVANLPPHDHAPPVAGTVDPAGDGQPFSNWQPAVNLNYIIAVNAAFPSRVTVTDDIFAGQVALFGGTFAPRGWAFADGSLLPVSGNEVLFATIGTTYGGNGRTDFALPDLRGRTPVGPDGASLRLGQVVGTDEVSLTEAQMPVHAHTLPAPFDDTGPRGGGATIDNRQPSLAINYLIATEGIFPGNTSPEETILGEITLFAGNFAPAGWAIADGSLLPIVEHPALFSLLRDTYGGDGLNNFALPDLRGRTAIGPDALFALGDMPGANAIALTENELPGHTHEASLVPLPASAWLLAGALSLLLGRVPRRLGKWGHSEFPAPGKFRMSPFFSRAA